MITHKDNKLSLILEDLLQMAQVSQENCRDFQGIVKFV